VNDDKAAIRQSPTRSTPTGLWIAIAFLSAALFTLTSPTRAADYVIIVNKDNANTVDPTFVAKLYRGDAKSWPAGGNASLYALKEDNPLRAEFDKNILDKTPSQSRAYWAALMFSGKGTGPKIVETDEDVIKAVSENKNALGYVSAKAATPAVKVIK